MTVHPISTAETACDYDCTSNITPITMTVHPISTQFWLFQAFSKSFAKIRVAEVAQLQRQRRPFGLSTTHSLGGFLYVQND